MSLATQMQVYTLLHPQSTQNPRTHQKQTTFTDGGTLTANISPLTGAPINSDDQRFFEATHRLITYNLNCGLKAGDRVRDQDGFEQEVIWVDRIGKQLVATLKKQVFSHA